MATQILNTPVLPPLPQRQRPMQSRQSQSLLEAEITEKFRAQQIKEKLDAATRSNFLGGLTSTMQLAMKAHAQGNTNMVKFLFSGMKRSVRANWKMALKVHPFLANAIVRAETPEDFFGGVPKEIAQEFELGQVKLGVEKQRRKAIDLELQQKQEEAEYQKTGKMSRGMGIKYVTNALPRIQQADQADPKTFVPGGGSTGGKQGDNLARMYAEVLRTSGQPELAVMMLKSRGIKADAQGRPIEPPKPKPVPEIVPAPPDVLKKHKAAIDADLAKKRVWPDPAEPMAAPLRPRIGPASRTPEIVPAAPDVLKRYKAEIASDVAKKLKRPKRRSELSRFLEDQSAVRGADRRAAELEESTVRGMHGGKAQVVSGGLTSMPTMRPVVGAGRPAAIKPSTKMTEFDRLSRTAPSEKEWKHIALNVNKIKPSEIDNAMATQKEFIKMSIATKTVNAATAERYKKDLRLIDEWEKKRFLNQRDKTEQARFILMSVFSVRPSWRGGK